MKTPLLLVGWLAGLFVAVEATTASTQHVAAPKVMIMSMYNDEDVWTTPLNLHVNITVPGMSPLFPAVHCNSDKSICHMITGEAEINAACSVMAILFGGMFDWSKTYFLIGGVAGVNPHMGTLGSVGLARFAVQVALAYEMDAREIPSNWTTGYWLQGTSEPGTMDGIEIYGTEVFELNTNLRDMAFGWIQGVTLNDTTDAQAWRSKFAYAPANEAPKVFKGDVATSDVYFAGDLLANAFANITSLWTNNTGEYAFTAQEDNATFEAMVRAHKAGLMDFARVILMRTASDMDRAPEGGVDEVADFLASQGGYAPALENIWVAGSVIVQHIIAGWDKTFKAGVPAQDDFLYNADVLHTLAAANTGASIKRRANMRRKRVLEAKYGLK